MFKYVNILQGGFPERLIINLLDKYILTFNFPVMQLTAELKILLPETDIRVSSLNHRRQF